MSKLSIPHPYISIKSSFERGLLSILVPLLVTIQFFYTIIFNFTPDNIRLVFAGFISLTYALISAAAVAFRPSNWNRFIILSAVLTIFSWSVSYGFLNNTIDSHYLFRDMTVYTCAIWILAYSEAIPRRLVYYYVVIAIIAGAFMAFTGNYLIEDKRVRLASITGGETTGLHPSAFFVVLNLFILDQLRRLKIASPLIAWPLIVLGIIVLYGYQVRTVFVMIAIYYLYSLYTDYKYLFPIRLLPGFLFGFFVICFVAFLTLTNVNVKNLGSGRVGAYMHHINLLWNRDVPEVLFGTGPGSDLFSIDVWGETQKTAHNDFLHILVEQGCVGLLGYFLLLGAISSRISVYAKALFVSLIVGSMIDNGLLSRPTLIPYLFYAMALATGVRSPSNRTHSKLSG